MSNNQVVELSVEQKIDNLRTEYEANIKLWIYEATFRQQRNQTFLTMNTILLTVFGTLLTLSSSLLNTSIIAIIISMVGFPACFMWHKLLKKNGEYMRFRRYQIRWIETQLSNITTFRNQWKALNLYEELHLFGLDDKFLIIPSARHSAISVENKLPIILAIIWAIIFIAALLVIGVSIF